MIAGVLRAGQGAWGTEKLYPQTGSISHAPQLPPDGLRQGVRVSQLRDTTNLIAFTLVNREYHHTILFWTFGLVPAVAG